jgi:hypothetical protein
MGDLERMVERVHERRKPRTPGSQPPRLQADVLTYRNGKAVKALSIGDTALQERIWGTK